MTENPPQAPPPNGGFMASWFGVKKMVPSTILPFNTRADAAAAAAATALQTPAKSLIATKSYDEAVTACKGKVGKIEEECRRFNRKYRDPHFDLSLDEEYCLQGLIRRPDPNSDCPGASARVDQIFENPVFFKDEAAAGDVEQGNEGDCWFLAAVATVTNLAGLVEKICVAKNEKIGVYGFVFMRDGEWESVIVDDQLFLKHTQFDDAGWEMARVYFRDKEEEYEKNFTKGSKALYFASCADQNETWLPLLEKAYAKFHGDYSALSGGFTGEAVEDLTGGVTTEIFTCDIMDTDLYWKEGISLTNKDFLFAAWIVPTSGFNSNRRGIVKGHAYSLLKAIEVKGERFVLLRNPWGRTEWTGPWSDGSKEWTPEWMQLLGHTFGDDGQFWMTYKDFLRKFSIIDRTRLFDSSWRVTEGRWLNYQVPWSADYAASRFEITVHNETPVVVVLSQLDTRFFKGLEGRYSFELTFRIHKDGEEDYLVRSQPNVYMERSVSAELKLEPGKYRVLYSVEPSFLPFAMKTKDIVQRYKNLDRKKFRQLAMNADLANARAGSVSFWREADKELKAEAANLFGEAPKPPGLIGDKGKSDDDDDGKSNAGTATPPQAVPETPLESAHELENYAWKARVCVGLKVYSKDQELEVHVVVPKEDAPADMVDLDSSNRDLHPEDAKEPGAKGGVAGDECTCGKSAEAGDKKKGGKETDGGNKAGEGEESGKSKGDGVKGGAERKGKKEKKGMEEDDGDDKGKGKQKPDEKSKESTSEEAETEKDGKLKGKSTEGGSTKVERCGTCGKRAKKEENKKDEKSTGTAEKTDGKTGGDKEGADGGAKDDKEEPEPEEPEEESK